MVEQLPDDLDLDTVFQALAHPIRRDILEQVADGPKSVSALAEPHDVSLAAVSKHLHVLEDAGLIDIEKDGRVRCCHFNAAPLSAAFGCTRIPVTHARSFKHRTKAQNLVVRPKTRFYQAIIGSEIYGRCRIVNAGRGEAAPNSNPSR